jgi:hypothetical protein
LLPPSPKIGAVAGAAPCSVLAVIGGIAVTAAGLFAPLFDNTCIAKLRYTQPLWLGCKKFFSINFGIPIFIGK